MDISRIKSEQQSSIDALRIMAEPKVAKQDSAALESTVEVPVSADEANLDGLQSLKDIVLGADEIRSDLVESLRQKIANGEDLSSMDTAEALMDSGFVDYLLGD